MANDQARVLTFDDLKGKGWPHTRMHTHRLVTEGKFPRPFKSHDGGRTNFWLETDIDKFLTDRAKTTKTARR